MPPRRGIQSANDMEQLLEPLAKRNLVLKKASDAMSRKNRQIGMIVTDLVPELSSASSDEIKAWVNRCSPYVDGAALVSSAVSRLSNVDVVQVFCDWLLPQVKGDCIPFEIAFAAYTAFCGRFKIKRPMKRRYFIQTAELYLSARGWIVPRSAKTGNPKAVNVYGWMVLPEPYIDSMVCAIRQKGWFSASETEEINKLTKWYPSQVTKPDFSVSGAFFKRDAYGYCLDNMCNPRRWIKENVLSSVKEPDTTDMADWKWAKLSAEWNEQMCGAIESAYPKFKRECIKWGRAHPVDVRRK